MSVTERNYLIIGGNSGIGKSVVEQLCPTGGRVWCASRRGNDRYKELGVSFVEYDINSGDVSGLTSNLPDHINGLVYCPGTINLKPFQMMKIDDFQNDLQINLLGAVLVLQACQKKLAASKNASVVLFSTVATRIGMSYHASIAAAKSAVEGLAISLAAEWARFNIRVNVIAPSLTDTPLAKTLLADKKRRDASAGKHPLKRIGKPEDIASMVISLLDDKSSWVTGQIIAIDGGISKLKPL